jgi:hypothetical protein
MRDEGRPFGVGFQEQAPNHSKLLRSKAVVVSVGVKALRSTSRQVWIRETNESKPLMTRRKVDCCRRNQGRVFLLGRVRRALGYWAYDGRRKEGVNLIWALVWNYGNQRSDAKGEVQVEKNHEARVPMRNTGADQPVGAMKAGNSAGAKGLGQAAAFDVQLVTGGGV